MKHIQLKILIVLFSVFNATAQNWKPVNQSDKYNYQLSSTDFITNTIKVDSVNVIEGDSILYLNRIVTNCDTCKNNEYNNFALKNQPQFLMRKMIKKSDSLFVFQDTLEYHIKPLSEWGESWVFDARNSIRAIVSYLGQQYEFLNWCVLNAH